jgi:predicted transposase/invertase (TIGR01784 family)
VALHQLPCTQETLWLRVLGRGTVQKQAIDELAALPANHPFRKVTLELLYNLQKNLNINQQIETDDRELVMRLAPLYQEDREKARQQGKQEGQQLGEQQIILRLLKRRFGELGLSVIEQIQGLSIDELESLGDVLLDFSKVGDLEVWLREKASQQ